MILICTTFYVPSSIVEIVTMYVCVCNAVTERQVKQAIQAGAVTAHQLKQQLNVATNCGTCDAHLQDMIIDVVNEETQGLELALAK